MKQTLLYFLVLFWSINLPGQNTEGHIKYNRTYDFVKVLSHLPFLTEEQKDRQKLSWGDKSTRATDYELYFNQDEMLFQKVEDEEKYWDNAKFLLIHQFKDNTVKQWIETLGKKYVITGKAPKYKWKILNEIKEVAGYLCMKAQTNNPILNQKISAWFATDIPVSGGPEGYYGLPGMILELDIDNGAVVFTAQNIKLEPVKIPHPKKMKGKKISKDDFDHLIHQFYIDMVDEEKNPFWQIRY